MSPVSKLDTLREFGHLITLQLVVAELSCAHILKEEKLLSFQQLYSRADATTLAEGWGELGAKCQPGWRTFGRRQWALNRSVTQWRKISCPWRQTAAYISPHWLILFSTGEFLSQKSVRPLQTFTFASIQSGELMKIGDLSPAGHYSISSVATFDLTCSKRETETLKNLKQRCNA